MVAFIGKQNDDQTVTFPDHEVRRIYAHIAKLETALGNLVRFDRGDTAIARGNYQNLMAEACEALGGDWKP